jgi:hypothetical protein
MTLLGIVLAVANGVWPVSFYIATLSFSIYLPVRLLSPLWQKHWRQGTRVAAPRTPPQAADQPQQSTPVESEQFAGLAR